jgi:hypothetical protein
MTEDPAADRPTHPDDGVDADLTTENDGGEPNDAGVEDSIDPDADPDPDFDSDEFESIDSDSDDSDSTDPDSDSTDPDSDSTDPDSDDFGSEPDGEAGTDDEDGTETGSGGAGAGAGAEPEPDTAGRTGATEGEARGGTDRPPADVRKYERFKKVDGAQYDRVNDFLRERTYITAREWAIARLCADFRTETGVEMTKIGDNLPELVPFMTDTYTPQAVNQARHAFRDKVRKSGATFLYGAMCGFFTAEELDELMYEVSEIAKFLLEVEGVDLAVAEELEAEERISSVMREVREASSELRAEDLAESADD